MKKMLKLFAAFAMISLAVSFAGCSMDTEDELLDSTEKTSGKETTSNAGSKETSGGNDSGKETETETNTGSDSSENESSSLWSMFDGADMQVWEKTATLEETDEGLDITIGSAGWWGMCFCNSASTGADSEDCVTFDMSKVKTITFEAKASKKASIWVSQSDAQSKPANQTKINLTTSFETKTFTLKNPGKKDYGVLDIGGGDLNTTTESDVVISIKNIKFLDSNGKEIVPTRNE